MVLSTFVRRGLLSLGAVGVAGTAAVAYAGSHDDEPNPEVRLFFLRERNERETTTSSTTSAFRLLPLSLSSLPPSLLRLSLPLSFFALFSSEITAIFSKHKRPGEGR